MTEKKQFFVVKNKEWTVEWLHIKYDFEPDSKLEFLRSMKTLEISETVVLGFIDKKKSYCLEYVNLSKYVAVLSVAT